MNTYKITPLHCSNCTKNLEARLRTLKNGENIRLNPQDFTLLVPEGVNVEEVKKMVEAEKSLLIAPDVSVREHEHDQHHHHHHSHDTSSRNISIVFFLNLIFSAMEAYFGVLFDSAAIVTDAIHDFGDALSIGLAWIFEKIASKEANTRYTFGHRRFSLLGALITSIVLIIGSIFSIIRSIPILLNPVEVNYDGMLILAIAAIAMNLFATWLMSKGSSHNEKILSLHVLEDALGWIAILIISIILRFQPWYFLDPLLSIALALFILYHALPTFKMSMNVFLEATPDHVDLDALHDQILEIDGIHAISHFHFWSIDGEENAIAITVYTTSEDVNHHDAIKEQIRLLLVDYLVSHSTIEVVYDKSKLIISPDRY